MKYLICFLLAIFATSAFAEPVVISKSKDSKSLLYAFPETYTVIKDGVSMMISFRKPGDTKVTRIFSGVRFEDCDRGFGLIYSRSDEGKSWAEGSNFVISDNGTVGDAFAEYICNYRKRQL